MLRGYGRKIVLKSPVWVGHDFTFSEELDYIGDEASLLSQACPHAEIMVCAARNLAIRRLESESNVKVILLDDGFQQKTPP